MQNVRRSLSSAQAGMTLVEVIVAMAISGLVVSGVVASYIYCTTSAEKAALSLAATASAMEAAEATRAAKWDNTSWPFVDQVLTTNFPGKVITLDYSGSDAGVTKAIIQTTISQVSTAPPLKHIRVECIWRFRDSELITNTIESLRAPDQ